ncbi:hypothetical protein LTR85_006300 [Meristemomyces frigidus]|nr:hypothetical protein LTR85_006300 [Meristemomyces frigidus]
MAAPSQIPGHPQTAVVDNEGDAFPSGSSFWLDNVCSDFKQSLAFDVNVPGASTWTGPQGNNIGYRWTIEYSDGDRTKIALKNYRGGYLAITDTRYASRMWLSNTPIWWYVYQGDRGHGSTTFWLSSTQSPDAFLHTWDCNGNDGADVLLFTNRDPDSGNFYGSDYDRFEQFSTGLSWQLRPTPEHQQWKQNNRHAVRSNQQGVCCNNCGQQCPSYRTAMKEFDVAKGQNDELAAEIENMQASLTGREGELKRREQEIAAREKRCQEAESDVQKRISALAGRESDIAAKGKSVVARETEAKKQQATLSAREEEARAAEQRVKNSEQSGPAEHLASQQESDKLAVENKRLRADVEAANKQTADLQRMLQQQQRNPTSRLPPSFSLKTQKRDISLIPPPMMLPKQEGPAQSLQKGFNPDLLKRFEAGREAMKWR